MQRTDQEFINAARKNFDTSVQELDRYTLSDLAAIRAHALGRRPARSRAWLLVPAAAVVFLGLAFVVSKTVLSPPALPPAPGNDIELMSAQEGLDLYDDFEFYVWLSEYEFPS